MPGSSSDAAPPALTWRSVARDAADALGRAGRQLGPQEVRWLVEEVTGATGADYLAVLQEAPTERRLARFDALVGRLSAGEPIQYVLGHWPFRHLDLLVDRRVLIPRPETEEVAGWALAEIDRIVAAQTPTEAGQRLPVVDLGTGSGAIALAIAQERTTVEVWATDRSPDALAVARANLAGLGRAAGRVRLVAGEWFAALPADLAGHVGLIVSNPPYVAAGDPLPDVVRHWEPAEALVSGPAGDEALLEIIAGAIRWLAPDGALVIELAPWQGEPMAAAARRAGFADAVVRNDLAGNARAVVARVRRIESVLAR